MIWYIYTMAAVGAGWETWLSTEDKKNRVVVAIVVAAIWPLFLGSAACALARDMGYKEGKN